MGLAADLGYSVGDEGPIRSVVRRLGSTRPVSAISRRILRPLDRFALRLTGRDSTVTSWLTGIPPLWLTALGARSGLARTVPLFGIPVGDDLALLGTSFGQQATPDWVHNLEANPAARASYRGAEVAVRARPATADEASAIWAEAAKIYPGYGNYRDWAAHRTIRVFVLELDEKGSGPGQVGSA